MDRIASERMLVGGDVNGQVGGDVGGFGENSWTFEIGLVNNGGVGLMN